MRNGSSGSISIDARAAWALFAAVWLVYLACPPFLSYDSYWSTATAVSIVTHRTTRVDWFVPGAPAVASYGLECPTGDHCYSVYPIGTPVLAAPLVALIRIAVKPIGPRFSRPEVRAFFGGDLMGGRPLTELACGSLIGALAVMLQYRIARLFLPVRGAIGLALLFAFGTSQWSVASRNLLPHGLTVLLLSGALYCFLRVGTVERLGLLRTWCQPLPYARQSASGRGSLGFAGFLLALAFTVRPSNAISCVVLGLYTAVHLRKHLLGFLTGAAPVAIAFFAYEVSVKHTWIPRYVRTALIPIPWGEGALMHLFSPSRGLVIFTPIVLVSAAGVYLAWRQRWCWPLAGWLATIPILHFALVAGAWPGHGYGPRFFADLTPIYIFFLIPAILWWRKPGKRSVCPQVFLLLAVWGIFVHAHGATSIAANQWSALPVDVDHARWRVWDWHDPQFLRGIR